MKTDKSVKLELDLKKLNESYRKMRPHMTNMEESFNQMSTETTTVQNEPLWMSKVDLEYAYG